MAGSPSKKATAAQNKRKAAPAKNEPAIKERKTSDVSKGSKASKTEKDNGGDSSVDKKTIEMRENALKALLAKVPKADVMECQEALNEVEWDVDRAMEKMKNNPKTKKTAVMPVSGAGDAKTEDDDDQDGDDQEDGEDEEDEEEEEEEDEDDEDEDEDEAE